MAKIDNKNNPSDLKFFIIHQNEVPLEPEDEHYGETGYKKFVLNKTVNEIMMATEQVPAIIKLKQVTDSEIQYYYSYSDLISLNENNNVLRILATEASDTQYNIDKNGYPYIIMEVPIE